LRKLLSNISFNSSCWRAFNITIIVY